MAFPPRVRNVAIVGHLHHGKSSIMDMLVNETHEKNLNIDLQERYTDTHPLERARGVSIKSMPMTLVMQDTKDVSYLLNVIDTPGNITFGHWWHDFRMKAYLDVSNADRHLLLPLYRTC